MKNQSLDKAKISEARQQYHGDFENFPSGYRFKPSEQELILYYLIPKLDKKELPTNIIQEVKLYKSSPDELAERYKPQGRNGEEWYFFTPRERKYRNGERPNRKAGDGYWKATGKDKEIKMGQVNIGSRKSLVFYKGNSSNGDKTNWTMHEFRADDSRRRVRLSSDDMQLDDWVLCRIRKKSPNKGKSGKHKKPKQEGGGDGDKVDDHEDEVAMDEDKEEVGLNHDNAHGHATKRRRKSTDHATKRRRKSTDHATKRRRKSTDQVVNETGPSNPRLPSPETDDPLLFGTPETFSLSSLLTSADIDSLQDIDEFEIILDDWSYGDLTTMVPESAGSGANENKPTVPVFSQ